MKQKPNITRQGDAIEVTPAMIAAGEAAYYDLKNDDTSYFGISDEKRAEGIKAIYLAMRAKSSLRNAHNSLVRLVPFPLSSTYR